MKNTEERTAANYRNDFHVQSSRNIYYLNQNDAKSTATKFNSNGGCGDVVSLKLWCNHLNMLVK